MYTQYESFCLSAGVQEEHGLPLVKITAQALSRVERGPNVLQFNPIKFSLEL
jgi:hypothetical protein